MSTTVTFAGNLAEAPELLYIRENKPFVSCRVLVNRRTQNDQGEWVNDEPTAHNVKIFGSAATHVHDSCGSGDPIFVHGLERTEARLLVQPLLATLTPRDRDLLRLRFGQELSQREIGLRLGMSQIQVSRCLQRLLVQLRGALAEAS